MIGQSLVDNKAAQLATLISVKGPVNFSGILWILEMKKITLNKHKSFKLPMPWVRRIK